MCEIKYQLTAEEYQLLDKYSDRLNTAVRSSYVRAIPSGDVHRMRMIYSRLIDRPYSMNESCSSCILTLCKKLKKIYDEYNETIKKQSDRQASESDKNIGTAGSGTVENGNTEKS